MANIEDELAAPQAAEPIDPATTPFVRKANFLIKKYGFAVSGKLPLAKMTDIPGWNSYNMLTCTVGKYSPVEFIRRNLKKHPEYANYEVVVVCTLGDHHIGFNEDGTEERVGDTVVLDIDAEGVLERIEAKIGRLPEGYTVRSRPNTAWHKQHRYFRHNAEGIELLTQWGIESAIKYNLKPEDRRGRELRIEGQWDLKGSGDGGYVVSADTPREGDEAYTAEDPEAKFPDLPIELVELLIEEDRIQWEQRRGTTRPNKVETEESDKAPACRHLLSRARTFANAAVLPEEMEPLLKRQLVDWAPDGIELVKDPEWIDRIHRYAHKYPTGSSGWWYKPREYRRMKKKPAVVAKTAISGPRKTISIPPKEPHLVEPLRAVIAKFNRDEGIPITAVRERLAAAMRAQGLPFDWRKNRNVIIRARDAEGWMSTEGRYALWSYTGVGVSQ
jgi:hypothetical protein